MKKHLFYLFSRFVKFSDKDKVDINTEELKKAVTIDKAYNIQYEKLSKYVRKCYQN